MALPFDMAATVDPTRSSDTTPASTELVRLFRLGFPDRSLTVTGALPAALALDGIRYVRSGFLSAAASGLFKRTYRAVGPV
jgi:hypothetical protein